MVCPKCEEGILKKILFTKNKEIAYLCDTCGGVWLEGERINETTGNIIQTLTKDGDMDYTFIDVDKQVEETKSVKFPKFK